MKKELFVINDFYKKKKNFCLVPNIIFGTESNYEKINMPISKNVNI